MPEPTLVSDPNANPTPTGGDLNPEPAKGFVGEDGKFQDGWLDQLPAEFADSKQILGKYQTLPDTLKALVESQKLIGKKTEGMIKLPGALKEGATDAEKAAHNEAISGYRKALGIPDKPEDYGLKPEQLPEGVLWDDNFGKQFSELAHKNNIPPAAMKELVQAYVGMEQARMTAQATMLKEEIDKGTSALKDAWKGNFETNIKTAVRVAKTVGLDVNSPGLRDPAVVQALHKMAGLISEDKLISGEFSGSSTPGKDRGMAIITGKTSDPELLRLHKLYSTGDKEANKMVTELLANG